MKNKNTTRRTFVRPAFRATLADRLIATGQHLRASEAIVAATFTLRYTAKHVQAGAR